jgi:HAD superfamily hydrolase (TIGR01509 family)
VTASKIELLLFDLGGVLVELGEHPIPSSFLKRDLKSDRTFGLDEWFVSDTAHRFEAGDISAAEFAGSLIKELQLSASTEQVIKAFTAWLKGLFPGAQNLLKKLQRTYRLAVLSNSNELHWPRIENEFGLSAFFERMFSSHLLKLAKPNPQAFEKVLDELQIGARQVLFFDDNQANINAANKLGIKSVLVSGLADVEVYFSN